MPLVCEGGLCEYVPDAGKKSREEQENQKLSTLSDTSDSPWEEEGQLEADGTESMLFDPKEARTYLIEDAGVDLTSATDSRCLPFSDSINETDGGGTFTLYNPYIISYVIDLQKTDPPVEVSRTLNILQQLFHAVSVDAKYGRTIGFHGGITAILTTMETHKKNAKVQEKSCALLGAMTDKNVELQEIVSANFGVTRILASMTSHGKGRAGLHREACYALSSILPFPANSAQFTLNRGVNVVMKSLRHFARSLSIQLYGTAILRILAKEHVGSIDYSQVVDHVVAAMRSNKRSNGIQINGCAVLYALSREGRNETQSALIKHDVVSLLLNCMKDNVDIAVIQCQCCAALTYLAQRRFEARDSMVREGAVSVIWASLKHHEGNQDVQEEGTRALRCLSKGPTGPPINEPSFPDQAQCFSDECY